MNLRWEGTSVGMAFSRFKLYDVLHKGTTTALLGATVVSFGEIGIAMIAEQS